MKVTVLGSTGFIGSCLVDFLQSQGFCVYAPGRQEPNWINEILSNDLGHVFYCIGLTANFREHPFETVEAHVCLLKQILEHGNMESLTYLSSTRVYENSITTDEAALLQGVPTNPGHLYNFSKLMGESLCLGSGKKTKVVRLSNVYGNDVYSKNFLTSLLKEAVKNNSVEFLTSPDSSKDYISINDVVKLLPRIAFEGECQIYNLASGRNTTNAEIASCLELNGIKTSYSEKPVHWSFPQIGVARLNNEFGFATHSLEKDLPNLLNYYRLKV